MTVYTDARTLELTLATIFPPHNSYCLHISLFEKMKNRSNLTQTFSIAAG